MASITSLQGVGAAASSAQVSSQYQIKTMKMQINAVRDAGDQALKLISAATIQDPAVGRKLNITA